MIHVHLLMSVVIQENSVILHHFTLHISTKVHGSRMLSSLYIYYNFCKVYIICVTSMLFHCCSHISFRESKLTRLLSSSLGGSSQTCILCTVSPNVVDETHLTLQVRALSAYLCTMYAIYMYVLCIRTYAFTI